MKENEIVFLIEEIHSIYVYFLKLKIFRMKKTVPSPDFDNNHYFFHFSRSIHLSLLKLKHLENRTGHCDSVYYEHTGQILSKSSENQDLSLKVSVHQQFFSYPLQLQKNNARHHCVSTF